MGNHSKLTLAAVLFLLGCGNCAEGLLLLVFRLGPVFPRDFITLGLFLCLLAGFFALVRRYRTVTTSLGRALRQESSDG